MTNATSAAQPDSPSLDRRVWYILLLIVALALRLPGMHSSLWFDELWSTRVVLGSVADLARQVVGDVHPPLYHALMFGWIRVFGDSELSVRAPALLAGLGTVALMPALGAGLASARAGWLAAAWLAISPVHIWYSHEARAYALVMLLGALLVLSYMSSDRRRGLGRPVVFALLSASCALLHYYALALPAALAVHSLADASRRRVAFTGLAAACASVLPVLALKYSAGAIRFGEWYLQGFTPATAFALFTRWFMFGGAEPAYAGAYVIATYLLTAGAALAAWLVTDRTATAFRDRSRLLALTLALPIAFLVLDAIGQRHFFIARSALPALPFFAIVMGSSIDAIRPPGLRRAAATVMVGCATAVVAGHFVHRDEWTVHKPKADWRTLNSVIAGGVERDGPTVLLGTTPISELLYYRPGSAECEWPLSAEDSRPIRHLRVPDSWLERRLPSPGNARCGYGGTAGDRLYTVPSGDLSSVAGIGEFEQAQSMLLVVSDHWPGRSGTLLAAIRADSSTRLTEVARAPHLQLYRLSLGRRRELEQLRPGRRDP